MASYIIKADGKVMHSEMEFVRQFLRVNFGEAAVNEGNQILLNLFEQRKQMDAKNPAAFRNAIHECGLQIRQNMSYEQRLQLLSFLAKIAQSDGNVCQAEIDALKEVSIAMGLSAISPIATHLSDTSTNNKRGSIIRYFLSNIIILYV